MRIGKYAQYRAPMGSLRDYFSLITTNSLTGVVDYFLKDESFKQALYIATPQLYRRISEEPLAYLVDSNLEVSLHKYINRYCTRATPFGTFAGQIYSTLPIETISQDTTRIPAPVAVAVYVGVSPAYRQDRSQSTIDSRPLEYEWRLNSSTKKIRDHYEFLKYVDRNSSDTALQRVKITSVLKTLFEYIEFDGQTGAQIVELISEISSVKDKNRCLQFFNDLRDSGFLLPSPGYRTEYALTDRLESVTEDSDGFTLYRSQDPFEDISAIRAHELSVFDTKPGREICDTRLNASSIPSLTHAEFKSLSKAIDALAATSVQYTPRHRMIRQWQELFVEKFGHGNAIPVGLALNENVGIGPLADYTHPARIVPLVADNRSAELSTKKVDHLLTELFLRMRKDMVPYVNLSEEDLYHFRRATAKTSRSVCHYMDFNTQMYEIDGTIKFLFRSDSDSFGGHSCARFLTEDDEQGITAWRQGMQRHSDLFKEWAEIDLRSLSTHIVTDPLGNHPTWSQFSLCLDTSSPGNETQQIDLSDLFVFASKDCLYLWSESLNCPVRVTSSNYVNHMLLPNEARFLLDVTQSSQSYIPSFSWRTLEKAPILPEVRYEGSVLRPAEWQIHGVLKEICIDRNMSRKQACDLLRQRLPEFNVPRVFVVATGDHRLTIDRDSFSSLTILYSLIKTGETYKLEASSLMNQSILGSRVPECIPELVLSCTMSEAVNEKPEKPKVYMPNMASFGSVGKGGYLSVKLYGRPENLQKFQYELLRDFLDEACIDSNSNWFFVKYGDPAMHLRLRFPINMTDAAVSRSSINQLNALKDQGLISNFVLENFEPEFWRYGQDGEWKMACEIFHFSSILALTCANPKGQSKSELQDFYRRSLVNLIEFVVNVDSGQFSNFFLKAKFIPSKIARQAFTSDKFILKCQELLKNSIQEIRRLGEYLESTLQLHGKDVAERRLQDIIHMHINRMYISGTQYETDLLWGYSLLLKGLHATKGSRS